MHEKKIGEPCPTCETPLQRRRSTFRTIVGDIAYCARCCSSFEVAGEAELALALPPELAPA
jgi:ssDNA-binding Zn-finger/Zn-ribbon topoisomerase 1